MHKLYRAFTRYYNDTLANPCRDSMRDKFCHKIYNFTITLPALSRFDSSFLRQTLNYLALVAVHTLVIVQAHSQFY